MALVLEYRRTFITALEEPREPEPQRRASSLPPTPSAPLVQAWEWELQGYVAELAQAADGLRQPSEDLEEQPEDSPEGSAAMDVDNSLGSRGHPDLCRRPCIYHRSGYCVQGADCGFCHLDHEGRAPKLDKKQREIIRSLNKAQVLATMLYYLRTYQKLELRADFLRLVERELWAQNKTESEALAEIPEKDRRRLHKTLARMSCSGLLGLASPEQAGAAFRQCLADATERLREVQ
ncbi:unnamed protein product [Effrenium voratum]|nr:unnamed protein product [Effrenium voratum]